MDPASATDGRWQALEFLLAFREDQAAGRTRSLRDYLDRFPDCEVEIAREFLMAQSEDGDEGDLRDFGPFVLQRALGQGAEGTVYLATDRALGREVALKILEGSGSDLEAARMQRAASALARLDHPAICQVYGAGREDRRLWIAMQYAPGVDLAVWLKQRGARGPRPRAREIGRLLQPIAAALAHAHERGVIHRDVKPSNIRVAEDDAATLTDFGLARDETEAPALTEPGALRGTPAYMAPELLQGAPPSPATDLWALGVVAFECAIGESPFADVSTAATLERVRTLEGWEHPAFGALDADLRAVIATALSRDPGQRYRDGRAFARDLEHLAQGRPVGARTPTLWQRVCSWSQRRPRLAAFGVATAAVLILGVATTSWLWIREQDEAARERERADALTKLVMSSAFDIQSRLALAPGNTALRERIVQESVDAVELLCRQGHADERLQRTRCVAWIRLGDVRGHPNGPNLGDREAARTCYQRADELIAATAFSDPLANLELRTTVRAKLADLDGDRARAKGVYRDLIEAIDDEPGALDAAPVRSSYAYCRMMLARCLTREEDFDAATREIAIAYEMLTAEGADNSCRRMLRHAEAARVVTLAAARDYEAAEALARKMLRECPPDVSLAWRAHLHRAVANCLMLQGRMSETAELFEDALALARRGVAAEPRDAHARMVLGHILRSRAMNYRLLEQHDLADADEQEAQQLDDRGAAR